MRHHGGSHYGASYKHGGGDELGGGGGYGCGFSCGAVCGHEGFECYHRDGHHDNDRHHKGKHTYKKKIIIKDGKRTEEIEIDGKRIDADQGDEDDDGDEQ